MRCDLFSDALGWGKREGLLEAFPKAWWSRYEPTVEDQSRPLLVTLIEDEALCPAAPVVFKILTKSSCSESLRIAVVDSEEIAALYKGGCASFVERFPGTPPFPRLAAPSRTKIFTISSDKDYALSSARNDNLDAQILEDRNMGPEGTRFYEVRVSQSHSTEQSRNWSSLKDFLCHIIDRMEPKSEETNMPLLFVIHSVTNLCKLMSDDGSSFIQFLDWLMKRACQPKLAPLAAFLTAHRDMEKSAFLEQLRSRADRIVSLERLRSGQSRHATGCLRVLKPLDPEKNKNGFLFSYERRDISLYSL